MKRYGQRVITLKDMVVEHLVERLKAGSTFAQLCAVTGASQAGLYVVLTEMLKAGELIQGKRLLFCEETAA